MCVCALHLSLSEGKKIIYFLKKVFYQPSAHGVTKQKVQRGLWGEKNTKQRNINVNCPLILSRTDRPTLMDSVCRSSSSSSANGGFPAELCVRCVAGWYSSLVAGQVDERRLLLWLLGLWVFFLVTPPFCSILIWFVMNTTPLHPPPALQLYLDALKLVLWWKMESFFILNLWLDGRINLLSGQQRSSPPLNLPQVPLHDFISVLWLRRWLEKTERKKKQTEVVNLLNSLTRFAVSAASAERVLIARFCTWKPDHLYTLNGFWMKSRKQQYGICISSRILYSRLYIEALTLKDEKQIHFLLWLRLILKFHQVVCGFLMTLPRKRKKISLHSGLQLVHTLAGGAMCGEPVWSTQVGVWFGI